MAVAHYKNNNQKYVIKTRSVSLRGTIIINTKFFSQAYSTWNIICIYIFGSLYRKSRFYDQTGVQKSCDFNDSYYHLLKYTIRQIYAIVFQWWFDEVLHELHKTY